MITTSPYIFIVDDDVDDIELLSAALEAKGVVIKSFHSGEEVLLYLEDHNIDHKVPTLIILDYNMLAINGAQTLQRIKSDPINSTIPVIMFSTSLSDGSKTSLMNDGALSCFVKPASYPKFLEQVTLFKEMAVSLM